MMLENRGAHAWDRTAITPIAARIGGKARTLLLWMRQAQQDRRRRGGTMSGPG